MRAFARGCLSNISQRQWLKRRRRIFHRLGTTCGETPTFRGTHGGLIGNPSKSPSRWKAAHDGRHLGQVDHALLRGRSWKAALPEGPRVSGDRRRTGSAQAGTSGGCVTGVQIRAPGENGSSSRSSHAPATEGVRVTRIGVTNPGARNRHQGTLGAAKAELSP